MKKAPVLGPVIFSLLAHGALVALMFLNMFSEEKPKPMNSGVSFPKPQIIETVSVDSKKVKELVEQIRKKKKNDTDKQKALEKKLANLESKRKKELARVNKAAQKRKKAEKLAKAADAKRKKNEKLAKQADAERIDKENKAELAKEKLADEQKLVDDAIKKREQEELKRIRQQELEQQMLEEQNALNAEHRQFVLTEKEKYVALIKRKIDDNLLSGVEAVVKVKLAPGGLVIDVNCIEGDPAACKAARIAVEKSEPLPISKDSDVFAELRNITLKLNKKIPGGL